MRATRFTRDAPRATLILAHPPSPDLSDCQLVQVPDAIFHLLRETPLLTCNISNNLISKIPPKLAMSFTLITGEPGDLLCKSAIGAEFLRVNLLPSYLRKSASASAAPPDDACLPGWSDDWVSPT